MPQQLNETTVSQHLKVVAAGWHPDLIDAMRRAVATVYTSPWFNAAPQRFRDALNKWTLYLLLKNVRPTAADDKLAAQDRAVSVTRTISSRYHDYLAANINNPDLISKLNTVDFSLDDLSALSMNWHNTLKKKQEGRGAPGKTILKFNDGLKWVSLGRGYCAQEGKAAGHCGNSAHREGDDILSLRDKNEHVHLTFVINNGMLGEMKGRGNEKPAQKYHDHIVALLRLPMVKGISGARYLPQNNFHLSDLPKDVYEKLFGEKPLLDRPALLLKHIRDPEKLKELGVDFGNKKIDGNHLVIKDEIGEDFLDYFDLDRHTEKWLKEMFDGGSAEWWEPYHRNAREVEDYIPAKYTEAVLAYLVDRASDESKEEVKDYRTVSQKIEYLLGEDEEANDEFSMAIDDAYRYGYESKMIKQTMEALEEGGSPKDADGLQITFQLTGDHNVWKDKGRKLVAFADLVRYWDAEKEYYDGDFEAYLEALDGYVTPKLDTDSMHRYAEGEFDDTALADIIQEIVHEFLPKEKDKKEEPAKESAEPTPAELEVLREIVDMSGQA